MTYACKICEQIYINRQTKYVHQLSCELKEVKSQFKAMQLRYELDHQVLNSSNLVRCGID